MKIIETERLIIRTWKNEDAKDFFQINQDPKVIEFLRGPMPMEDVMKFIATQNQTYSEHKFALWAIEVKMTHALIGFVGLSIPSWDAHFTPCVEIGWRLGSQYWDHGYAFETAKAVLNYGFNTIGLTEIVSFTIPQNARSIKLMEKIGMKRDFLGDFFHPHYHRTHPLSKHVLYRITIHRE